ncbi:MAG: hypothetical protein BMS9Abin34_499 [Patescibacteria group bacterium]|nr:MAG: hypothetical protein BMS9Abin34_499 [Patescibacteria group bacterium]
MVGSPRIGKDKVQLLKQALMAASSSLKLANQLLNEIERMGGASSLPGLIGKYDGRFMVTEAGKKYPVPDNYSAKTRLVYGDKLKMVEGPMGRQFKLLEKLPRLEEDAQLVVKDGQFEALGKGGSYRLLQSAVRYWGGEEKDKVKVLLPEGEKNIPFACLLEVVGKKPGVRGPEEDRKPLEKKRSWNKKEAEVKEKPKEEPKKELKKEPEEKAKPVRKVTVQKEEKKEAPPPKTTKKPPVKRVSAAKPPEKEKTVPKKEAEPVGEEELR